ncbi:transposase [Pirellula sp. SH-Sr6A]
MLPKIELTCYESLCVYATDGRLQIDNNQVERLMKRVAIGRKN